MSLSFCCGIPTRRGRCPQCRTQQTITVPSEQGEFARLGVLLCESIRTDPLVTADPPIAAVTTALDSKPKWTPWPGPFNTGGWRWGWWED